ncbi:FAD-dependent oxidoreductase [Pontibacter korlensis]|uniref:Rieske domain-containing protein n=1 Tax=Pontibacter korlensis TaxID=400092 RepID=A0A0E3UWJ5_9BACT|nr:FAD-dependent oxidoreductase [Pontibacter korlensis]AKD02741.1 hypothetical protein PKOR_05925 [Pontibacter korlensis]
MAADHITQALWSATTPFRTYPQLSGDIEVDVAIVGAGITGISTAYNLARAGQRVAVLEALKVGSGTTGSSTGNLYAPVDERLYNVESKHNEETLKAVASSRSTAVDFIEQRVQEYNIDCEFKRVPWYLFSEPGNDLMAQVERERRAAEKAGLPVTDQAPAGFPFKVESITNIANQAQFNPLKYVQGLAAAIEGENCRIFEGTKVTNVEDGEPCVVHTEQGKVTAKHVVMATHSPKGIYAVHTAMEPYREYAMAVRLKGEVPAGGVYWHVQQMQHYSVRPYSNEQGNYLLVLGEAHKVGHQEHNEENFLKLEQYLTERFDVDHIVYKWAAQNYKPADVLPYIGTSPMQDHTYIATGFAADGLTWGTVAGMIITDAILEKENPWATFFDPKRFTPIASAPKFAKENISVATHLVKDWLFYGEAEQLKDIKPGEGKTIEIDDEKLAAYRDDEGKLHVVSSVCTHMGCIVHFNNAEKSWDCPCHGSRFSVEGEVLEGPAYYNLAKPDATKND